MNTYHIHNVKRKEWLQKGMQLYEAIYMNFKIKEYCIFIYRNKNVSRSTKTCPKIPHANSRISAGGE